MSRAVRIRAIRVEVKWTVMSSATGIFIRTNLCAEEKGKSRRKKEKKGISKETRVRWEEKCRGRMQRRKRRARIPHPSALPSRLLPGPGAALLGNDAQFHHSPGRHRGPENVFHRDAMGFLGDVAQGKESALGGGSRPCFKAVSACPRTPQNSDGKSVRGVHSAFLI